MYFILYPIGSVIFGTHRVLSHRKFRGEVFPSTREVYVEAKKGKGWVAAYVTDFVKIVFTERAILNENFLFFFLDGYYNPPSGYGWRQHIAPGTFALSAHPPICLRSEVRSIVRFRWSFFGQRTTYPSLRIRCIVMRQTMSMSPQISYSSWFIRMG